jgi:hypothetical protein
VTLLHGKDSYNAGISVFGVHPDDLVLCACGTWEQATFEDAFRTLRRTLALLSVPPVKGVH